ncbi:MAG: hydrogenase maturation protease [Actinomycetota bacterium]
MDDVENIKTVILGIGNILLGDEGIGVKVIEELEKENLPTHVKPIDGATAGFGLLPIFEKYKNCQFLIVDAIKIINKKSENNLYVVPLEDIYKMGEAEDMEFISFHQTSIMDVLNLLYLTSNIKLKGYLFGINVCSNKKAASNVFKFTMDLSPQTKAMISKTITSLKKYF